MVVDRPGRAYFELIKGTPEHEALQARKRAEAEASLNGQAVAAAHTGSDGCSTYGLAALADECDRMAATGEGSRNAQLNAAAYSLGQLIGSGHLTRQRVITDLTTAATAAGLPASEISQVLRPQSSTSPLAQGAAQPRVPAPTDTYTGVVSIVPAAHLHPPAGPEEHEPEQERGRGRTSWWPEPIEQAAAKQAAQQPPEFLTRADGQSLMYRGKINGLIGESESGKSWLALLAAKQAAQAGHRVCIFDFEDDPGGTRSRLATLGCDQNDFTNVTYAQPDQIIDALAAQDIRDALDTHYDLIIADGLNAALNLLGLSINDNNDVTKLFQQLLFPLARSGACVLTVDHVTKSAETRGKGALGAQAKRAMISGCALSVEVVQPFGVGQPGELKLWVDKDRPGVVRSNSGKSKYAGMATITPQLDCGMNIVVEPPGDNDSGPWQPTGLMEKISRYLEVTRGGGGLSKRAVEDGVGGAREYVHRALMALVSGGWVSQDAGPRGAVIHRLERPYREGDLPVSGGSQ